MPKFLFCLFVIQNVLVVGSQLLVEFLGMFPCNLFTGTVLEDVREFRSSTKRFRNRSI